MPEGAKMTLGQPVKKDQTKIKRTKSVAKVTRHQDTTKTGIVYDPEAKCWKTSAKGKVDTLKITRMKQNKEKQRRKQDPERVPHDRKKAQGYSDPDLDDDEDTVSVSMDVYKEIPRIRKPFVSEKSKKDATNWSMPMTERSVDVFRFEKPVTVAVTDHSISSPTLPVQRLERHLAQRDTQLDILRKQLFKSQRENMKLVNEMSQCSGQRYDDVVKENTTLKQQVDRLTRQVTNMWANDKRHKNPVLLKLQYEEKLQAQKVKEFSYMKN